MRFLRLPVPMRNLAIGAFLLTSVSFAQPTLQDVTVRDRYERKSISYALPIYARNDSIDLNDRQKGNLESRLRGKIEMERFDYNPLPSLLLEKFLKQVRNQRSVSEQTLKKEIEASLLPSVIEILNINKELRAQNLLTEEQKNSFIATKAKSLGITVTEILKVMNAGFIYIPFVSQAHYWNTKNGRNFDIAVGILWLRVRYDRTGDSWIEHAITSNATYSIGLAVGATILRCEGIDLALDEYLLCESIGYISEKLHVETRKIPEFNLVGKIVDVEGESVYISLGQKEGIGLDDEFEAYDFVERGGIRVPERVGLVRVSNVAGKSDEPRSETRKVISNGIDRGMNVKELPRYGLEGTVKLSALPASISAGEIIAEKDRITFDATNTFICFAQVCALKKSSKNVSQLYYGGEFFAGIMPCQFKVRGKTNSTYPCLVVVGFSLDVQKRFSLRRVSIAVGGQLSIQFYTPLFYSLTTGGGNAMPYVGLEYRTGYDTFIGARTGYNFPFISDKWSQGEQKDLPGPQITPGPMTLSIYLGIIM
jgi:hypothetical protein